MNQGTVPGGQAASPMEDDPAEDGKAVHGLIVAGLPGAAQPARALPAEMARHRRGPATTRSGCGRVQGPRLVAIAPLVSVSFPPTLTRTEPGRCVRDMTNPRSRKTLCPANSTALRGYS